VEKQTIEKIIDPCSKLAHRPREKTNGLPLLCDKPPIWMKDAYIRACMIDGAWYVSVFDIFQHVLGMKNPRATAQSIIDLYPNLRDILTYCNFAGQGQRDTLCFPAHCFKDIIKISFLHSSLCNKKKTDVLNTLDIPYDNNVLLKNKFESDTMRILESALAMYSPTRQFHVGSYRIDMYLPHHKVAIECDEYDHAKYDRMKEKTRQEYIENTIGARFVRYNPSSDNFCIGSVIHAVLLLIHTV